jgi:cobalt/nickel transport protein
MKYWPYLLLTIALPTLFLIYIISLGYTPLASAVLILPNETEILLFTVFVGVGAATLGHFLGYLNAERGARNNVTKLENKQTWKAFSLKYVVILIVVIALFMIPFIVNRNANFGGSDSQGPEAIEETGYSPWVDPMGYKPDALGEKLLFSLQVAIGGTILGLFVGHETGKRASKYD